MYRYIATAGRTTTCSNITCRTRQLPLSPLRSVFSNLYITVVAAIAAARRCTITAAPVTADQLEYPRESKTFSIPRTPRPSQTSLLRPSQPCAAPTTVCCALVEQEIANPTSDNDDAVSNVDEVRCKMITVVPIGRPHWSPSVGFSLRATYDNDLYEWAIKFVAIAEVYGFIAVVGDE